MARSFKLDWESAFITGVYTAGWGLLLLATGRYWDDWAALDLSAKATAEWSRQQGLFWQLDLLGVLSALPGTERIGHIMTFFAFLACALILHRLLRAVPTVSVRARVMIPAIFAVFPVNSARFALVTLMYAISLAVFMIAWWIIAVDLSRPTLWRKAVAGGLLIFAMLSTASLLVFSMVIPAYVLWARWADLRIPGGRRSLAVGYGFLLALPVVAWVVRSMALQPSGLYVGYNELKLSGALQALGTVPGAFMASLVNPMAVAFSSGVWISLVGALVLYGLIFRRFTVADVPFTHWSRDLQLLGVGFAVFILAVFPYLAVGKVPQANYWDSRHQLLVPFGAALLLYAAVALLVRALRLEPRVAALALCVLLSGFAVGDLQMSLDYQGDWYKQVSLLRRMAESEDLQAASMAVFLDRAPWPRGYSFYEYNGMMHRAFGDATRLGIADYHLHLLRDIKALRSFEQYNFWQYRETPNRVRVTITPGLRDVRKPGVVLGLMWRETLVPELFDKAVLDVVRIETNPWRKEAYRQVIR